MIVLVLDTLLISLISSIKFLHISWFKSSEEVNNIRKGVENLCPRPGSDILSRGTEEQFSLVIYQRNLNRRFKHLSYIVNAINSNISSFLRGNLSRRRWQVLISIALYVCTVCITQCFLTYMIHVSKVKVLHHHDDLHPCEVYHNLHSADILLASHGFQNTGQGCLLLSSC